MKKENFEKINYPESEEEPKNEKTEEEKRGFLETLDILKEDINASMQLGRSIKKGQKLLLTRIKDAKETLKNWSGDKKAKKKILQEFKNLKEIINAIKFDDVDIKVKLLLPVQEIENMYKEKELGLEEIEELEEDMGQYVEGLHSRIEEIKAELEIRADDERAQELRDELEELEREYEGLKAFVDDIKAGDYEEITEKPVEERGK